MEGILTPFEGYLVNPSLEMLGVTAYIGLAQSFQTLADVVQAGDGLSPSDANTMLDTLCLALEYLSKTGIPDRHPDLAVMPLEVSPHDFQGDTGQLIDWLAQELVNCVEGEHHKAHCLLN
jgi:hypothetical protein